MWKCASKSRFEMQAGDLAAAQLNLAETLRTLGTPAPASQAQIDEAFRLLDACKKAKYDGKCSLSAELLVAETEADGEAEARRNVAKEVGANLQKARDAKAELKRIEKRRLHLHARLSGGPLDERQAEELEQTYDSVDKLMAEVEQGEARVAALLTGGAAPNDCGKGKRRAAEAAPNDCGKGKRRATEAVACGAAPNGCGVGKYDAEASGSRDPVG